MKAINPYIGFNGKCREAMTFYKECLGGKLELKEATGSPSEQFQDDSKNKILHSSLTIDGVQILMGSDMTDQDGYTKGNNIALALNCDSETEIFSLFDKLSKSGRVSAPLKEEFWGAIFGTLVDQFGIKWMLNFNKG